MSTSSYPIVPKPTVFKLTVIACPVNPTVIFVGLIAPTSAAEVTPVKPTLISSVVVDPISALNETPVKLINSTEVGVRSVGFGEVNSKPVKSINSV